MKIGIIDADLLDNGTRHPNLACMKISGYHNEIGNSTELLTDYDSINSYDKVYISKVFDFTEAPIGPHNLKDYPNVEIGGTGYFWKNAKNLPSKIEHHMPDYHLYDNFIGKEIARGIKPYHFKDYIDYSIGFTTRGCFRKCSFCVNEKYNRVFKHSPVKEFLDNNRKYIYLWDDNILGYAKWEEIFDELNSSGKAFQFRQGMDMRLMSEKKAQVLTNSHYHGDFIFAFDHIEEREIIEKKLKIWRKYNSSISKLYVLCAYDSIDEIDIANTFERIRILMQYKCLPYIMRYENYKKSKFRGLYITIARWCNQPGFLKKKSFREYCEANQEYKKNKSTLCSSMKSMVEFEKEFPEIAQKYFDIKWEDYN